MSWWYDIHIYVNGCSLQSTDIFKSREWKCQNHFFNIKLYFVSNDEDDDDNEDDDEDNEDDDDDDDDDEDDDDDNEDEDDHQATWWLLMAPRQC